MGGAGIAAVRARDRLVRRTQHAATLSRDADRSAVHEQFQSDSRQRRPRAWVSAGHFGLDQGIVVMMIENHRTQLIWRLMRDCPYVGAGLRRAGFRGGWL